MDLGKALQDLYAERQKLEHIIATLQELQQGDTTTRQRRGRRGIAERESVTDQRNPCRAGRKPSGIAPNREVSSAWRHHDGL